VLSNREFINTYEILIEKPLGKRFLRLKRTVVEDNMKMHAIEIDCEDGTYVEVVFGHVQWWALGFY
jgi:hypothetical protein